MQRGLESACAPHRDNDRASACRIGAEGDRRSILELVLLLPLDHAEFRVNDAEPPADDVRSLAVDVIGKAKARREVPAIGMPECRKSRLALLNQSRR